VFLFYVETLSNKPGLKNAVFMSCVNIVWPGPLFIFLYLALTKKSLDTPAIHDVIGPTRVEFFQLKCLWRVARPHFAAK